MQYVNEYWFEDLNLRGSYKTVILDYIQEKHPELYPTYEKIYLKGDHTPLDLVDKIKQFCADKQIIFSDYFHHKEVVSNPNNKILGKNR